MRAKRILWQLEDATEDKDENIWQTRFHICINIV